MSSGSGAGPPPPGGVVRSSALSFVASAQPTTTADTVPGNSQEMDREQMGQTGKGIHIILPNTLLLVFIITGHSIKLTWTFSNYCFSGY